ncbi:MBL fold metallo-hydrolase [Acidisoma cellulosilytica]|uniref:MBL fold metallo-hydrolase n=1 Tax=Acidisoma cellulosilyticum TaxID=2802395 RepID=A0A963Z667_9PROT|nr:MBL fold metallo-hydrolase [Acidisoma cellulosilyticum]MCB8882548.1 MBL fold metallo-hydrolase [Acidisoma cellulosilyticum]
MADKTAKQVPGIYRHPIGDAMVTVINDGFLDIPFEILRGVEQEEMHACMRGAFWTKPPRLTVNAFVIETAGRTILVDAGGGSSTIYSMGLLPENLKAAGFAPEDFDTVLLSHIHPDHSNGLLDPDGKAMFPRAELVIHKDDVAFWSDPALRDGRVPAATPYLDAAQALLTTYRDHIRLIDGGEVLSGITQLPLPGHTPGHSGYRLDSAGETLVIWGDTVHVPEIQIPHPGVTSEFDINEALAAENRRRIFETVATERLLVAGMHLHLPAFAHVVKSNGSYRLVPENWAVAI